MGHLIWNMLSILLFAGVAQLAETRNMDTYKMDVDAADNVCGNTVEIPPSSSARITSSGKAPNGYCSLLFYAVNNDTHKCDTICVEMNKTRVDVCTAKVVFSGIHFASEDKTMHKELSCWHISTEPICLHSKIMRIEIIEKHHYAFHWPKRSYEFDGTVFPKCHKLAPGESFNIDVSKRIQKEEEKENDAYVYGVVVALCLASIFLIILLIMYCHYKATGTRMSRTIPMPRVKKALTFSGMRHKLSFNRLHSSSSGKSPKSPNKKKENFKFEEEKNETEPLVTAADASGAAAAAVALEEKIDECVADPDTTELQPTGDEELIVGVDDLKTDQSEPLSEPIATVVDIEPIEPIEPSLTD